MNILFIGDIVAKPGREALVSHLGSLKEQYNVDFVIANAENSAGGFGITESNMKELMSAGIDVLTGGNHIWKRKEVLNIIDRKELLRPANYPDINPGCGYDTYMVNDIVIGVLNLQGRVFMDALDSPFTVAERILEHAKADIIIVDFHAEATSEKIAMSWFLDGRVTALIGTHTHVQTSDARILPMGTGYITDAGMTGSKSGVIGVRKDEILKHFLTGLPFGYKYSTGDVYIEGVLVTADNEKIRCIDIKPIRIKA
ncbi:MAG: TIGR00282 family metallophosphoesterase [Elusimicrobiota bacterium]